MQQIPRSERHYRVTGGSLAEAQPVVRKSQLPAKPNHDQRQLMGRKSRQAFKRVGTAPASKLGQLKDWERNLWHEQRPPAPVMSRFHAEKMAAAFAWLFEIPELHAMAEGE
jgi:hypothetical protein